MKLHETLIVANINVNLFSLQRVVKKNILLVYGEVEGKCIMKRISMVVDTADDEMATMAVIDGRATIDNQVADRRRQTQCKGGVRYESVSSTARAFRKRRDAELAKRRSGPRDRQSEGGGLWRLQFLQAWEGDIKSRIQQQSSLTKA